MSGHLQRVENVRSSDMDSDHNGWMGIVRSSDKAAYKLRMVICTYKLIYNGCELNMNGWIQ
jgi:hypothetical protein